MRVTSTAVTLVVALLLSTTGAAQTPNFSGKWTVDPAAPGGGRGGLGQQATIKQDDKTLTITRTTQMGEFTSTYNLDGSESKNTLNFQGNALEQLSKARWDGGKLVVDTTMTFDGNPIQLNMTMALDPAGNLIVESTRPDPQGGGPVTTKLTYKKN